jgi:hypothetical protein
MICFALRVTHQPLVWCFVRIKDRTDVEYALRGMSQPLGVSSFELSAMLPKELEGVLPTVAQLEALLDESL